ncbi:MAG: glycine zipper family protein [Myxococcota bacterium]
MADFLQILLTFPTSLFGLAFALATAFWAFSLLGGLDGDMLDGDIDVDVDVDVDVDADVDADAEMEGSAASGAWVATAQLLRLGRVPVTVTLSLLALGGFVSSFLLTWLSVQLLGAPGGALLGVGILAVSLVGAIATANVGSRPLEPVFRTITARSNHALKGEVCRVTTGRVDETFGQAEVVVDHDHLTIQVRCDTEGAQLPRGSEALIIQFDAEREAFVVEPLENPSTEV